MSEGIQPVDILAARLRHAALRQRTAAGNLANQSTPGFKAKRVQFEEAFKRALDRGDRKAALKVEAGLVDHDGPSDATGNTVDLDTELLELQDAGLEHKALARLINLSLKQMRLATGGQ
jgi:flagellar basal-body rod protein FlgB